MRVLVTWGSKRGGTEGIARVIGEELENKGYEVDLVPAERAAKIERFDAVIIGGALYANRWHGSARSFVTRRLRRLHSVPVWFFSSGPLDDSADDDGIGPAPQVRVLMERAGALGHRTFGGRLAPDAHGFTASSMAKKHAGDWRNPDRIRGWAGELARALPAAKPGVAVDHPARSLARFALHALAGWAMCAAIMGALLAVAGLGTALALHAIAAPVVFTLVARHYFAVHGARDPLPTAAGFTAMVALLDLVVVAGALQRNLAMFASVAGTWLPLALIFLATWATGEISSMLPIPRPPRALAAR